MALSGPRSSWVWPFSVALTIQLVSLCSLHAHMRNQATGHSSSRPSLLDRQTRAEEVPDFMRTPSSRHSIPGPPASPRLKQHHRIGEHGLPRAVMLRALSWCILARREHNSVLHMLSATPTCHPYWWCAGAGITLERHGMLRHENHCRCPYTYVSLRVLLCTTFCQVEATPQLYQFLSPESPRPLPVRLIGTPTPLRFLFPTAAIAHLREGVRLNPRFPL